MVRYAPNVPPILMTCTASVIDSTMMNALIIEPIKLDKSRPADLNAFPVIVWSKLFSMPSFSTILFTALPTKCPMA